MAVVKESAIESLQKGNPLKSPQIFKEVDSKVRDKNKR